MKKKITAIGIVSMFLLTALSAMSVVGMEASLSEQPLHNKNNVVDEYDGDLWCLEPNIDKIGDGLYNCQVRFRNKHEDFAVPGGWEAKVLWQGDPEKEIGRGTYMNDVPPEEYRDDFNITIKPEEKGVHWVLVVLDCEDVCDETNETNNEAWALHLFTRAIGLEQLISLEPGIYIDNAQKMPFPITIFVGDTDIEVDATDDDGIDRVEFYIDDEPKETDTTYPYSWLWDEFSFGRHTLKVIAYDNAGNSDTDEMIVWKFF